MSGEDSRRRDHGEMSAPTGALAVLGRRRRVIEDGGSASPESSQTPPWVTGVLAAVQAGVLSFALVVLPAITAYVATSADPSNVGTSWFSSVRVASGLWLLGHGTPLTAGGSSVSLIPLGLAAVVVFACYASARRTAQATWSAFGAGVGAYCVFALLIALIAGVNGPGHLALTVLGAGTVAALGLGGGVLKDPKAPGVGTILAPVLDRVPPVVVLSMRAALLACASLVIGAVVLVIAWIFMGRTASVDVINALSLSFLDGLILALAQALFVANLVVWALAWIAGPGFSVGVGSQFSPTEVVEGPLPAMPILGALPGEEMVNSLTMFAPAVVVVCGMLAAVYVRRRSGPLGWREVGLAAATITVTAGALVAVLTVLAGGAIGPGRMSEVGAAAAPVAGAVMVEILLGSVIVLAGLHASTRTGLRALLNWRNWRAWFHRATGSTASDAPAVTATPLTPRSAHSIRTASSMRTANSMRTAASSRTGVSARTARSVRTTSSTATAPSALTSPSTVTASSIGTARSSVTSQSPQSAPSASSAD